MPKGNLIGPDGEIVRPAEPPRGGGDDLEVLEEASDPLDEMGTVEARAMRYAMAGEDVMASTHSMTSTIATREEDEEEEEEMPTAMGDTGVMRK